MKPTKRNNDNANMNNCQLIDFMTFPYGKSHYYEFVKPTIFNDFLVFLKKIMKLNLFVKNDRVKFINEYNDCYKKFTNNNPKELKDDDWKHNEINDDDDDDDEQNGYFKLIELFQKKCLFRFGIVEGLHRTSAMLNAIYLTKEKNTYIQSTNRMYITSNLNDDCDAHLITQKLKTISNQYMEHKQIVFQNTSIDNLRNLWLTMLRDNLFEEENLYINRIPKTKNFNDAKLNNAEAIFHIIRDKVKSIINYGNNDWCEALIKNEDASYLNFFQNEENLPEFVKKMAKSYPAFHYLKPGSYRYTAKNNMNLLFDISGSNYVKSVVLQYRQFLISECVLLHFFLAATLNKSLGRTLKNILFEDRTKKMKSQISLQDKKRSFLNLDTLSKLNL